MKSNKRSAAFRSKMSRIMTERWAFKRSRKQEAAKRLIKNIAIGNSVELPTAVPVNRFKAFNYCPNCGVHLSRLYPYEH
jgi:hypothetical protein